MEDRSLMKDALDEALKAFAEGEVPIGAVVAREGRVIARAHNIKEGSGDPTAHAEILAMREAARVTGDWRLLGMTIYVTAEPCLMCLGAALQARLEAIVFGCREPKFGAVHLITDGQIGLQGNHELVVRGGVLAEECAALLRRFFEARRG